MRKEHYMEDYKAQYYNEALLHFGVKGMKWGVRRARLAKLSRRMSKHGTDAIRYGKAFGRTYVNLYAHPQFSTKALTKAHTGKPLKAKELERVNADVKRQIAAKKQKRMDKKIDKLKTKRENQSQKLVSQLSKHGMVSVRQFNKPNITNSKIKYAKIKRAGLKAGDSRNTTRLKIKKQKLNDRIIKSQNGFALTGEMSSGTLKRMQKDRERIAKINKKLANKKRKKR